MSMPSPSQSSQVKRHQPAISKSDEMDFGKLVGQRLGMEVRDHQRPGMRVSLENACRRFGHSSAAPFLRAVKQASLSSPEWEYLVAQVTVGESYFFRDEAQFNWLEKDWLPAIVAEKRRARDFSLRIWSAGCSDGQELYSIAIMLNQNLPEDENWKVTLLGTDVNVEALNTAVRGKYSAWSFRATPVHIVSRYFNEEGNSYVLRSDIRNRASFAYCNLVEDTFPSILNQINNLDLIICRNVFIYFSINIVRKIMEKFSASLVPGGTVLIGASDPVESGIDGLIPQHGTSVLHFRRSSPENDLSSLSGQTRQNLKTHSQGKGFQPGPAVSSGVASSVSSSAPRPLPVPPGSYNKAAAEKSLTVSKLSAMPAVSVSADANSASTDALVDTARKLADQGNLDGAAEICHQLIEKDSLASSAHFLLALIYIERADAALAEAALRKVLFLDRNNLEAHFQLGLLNIHAGRRKIGVKGLEVALELALRADPEKPLLHSPGMTVGRFVEILQSEIAIYEEAGK
jgi:chemotaxis protein methyltransferase CheR